MAASLAHSFTLYNLDSERGALHDLAAQAECLSDSSCDNFWVPKAELDSASADAHIVERWICSLYQNLMRSKVSDDFAGVEYWVQVPGPCPRQDDPTLSSCCKLVARALRSANVLLTHDRLNLCCAQRYEKGRGLAFHFDKDEHAMRETGAMLQPQLSSIVYLTGGQRHAKARCALRARVLHMQSRGCDVSSAGIHAHEQQRQVPRLGVVSHHVCINHVERQAHICTRFPVFAAPTVLLQQHFDAEAGVRKP